MAHNTVRKTLFVSRITDWAWWAFGNLVAGVVGWGIVAAFLLPTLGIFIVLSWLVLGISTGIAQYLVISRKLNTPYIDKSIALRPTRWMSATIGGVLLSFLIQWALPALLYSHFRDVDSGVDKLVGYGVGGAVYGLLQALALKQGIRGVGVWSLVCALGWSVGTCIGLSAAQEPVNWLSGHKYDAFSGILIGPWDVLYVAIEGTVGTAIFGIITGLFLSCLHWPPLTADDIQGKRQREQNDPA